MRGLGKARPGHKASRRGPDCGPDILTTATADGAAVEPEDTANIVSATIESLSLLDLRSVRRVGCELCCRKDVNVTGTWASRELATPFRTKARARRIEVLARRQDTAYTIL